MRRLTDSQARACPTGKKISEAAEPTGALILWHKNSGSREWYYRKQRKGAKDINEKLGTYPDLKLADARQKASSVAKVVLEHSDLKKYRRDQTKAKQLAESKAIEAETRADSLGSLSDLCHAYVTKMEGDGRASAKKVGQALKRYVLDPFPTLAITKANEITTEDIASILSSMMDRGITTHTNRTRGDLHAAFNVGLCYDFTPALRQNDSLFFEIHNNPVTRIKPTKKYERALMRNLTKEELRLVWFQSKEIMNPVYSALLRIMICTGFHPAELLRLQCKDVNLDDGSIYMTQTKSGVPNLIPINQYAHNELCQLLHNSNPDEDLFPSRVRNAKSDIYARVSVVANQVKRLRDSLPQISHFTARDFRRTVKTQMGAAGVPKEIRDRLQNHALQDVSSRHYDRYSYWTEKHFAMLTWEDWLTRNVIEPGEHNASKIVQIRAAELVKNA
jgi:integrase